MVRAVPRVMKSIRLNKDIRAEIKVGNDLLGWVNDDGFEIDFEKLVELATEERMYLQPSKYPSIIRDISLLINSLIAVNLRYPCL